MAPTERARFDERGSRWSGITRARRLEDEQAARAQADTSPISPLWLSYQIGRAMDENCLMLDETLMLSPLPPYLRFSQPGTYFRNPGSGGGWCAGAALGAKLGRPDKDVVAVTGDGFYMYSVANAAIASAMRYKAPFMSVRTAATAPAPRPPRSSIPTDTRCVAASKPAISIRPSISPRKQRPSAPTARTSRSRAKSVRPCSAASRRFEAVRPPSSPSACRSSPPALELELRRTVINQPA
jgi:hypothetical protein